MNCTVELIRARVPRIAENPGYLAGDRAESYGATQEIVVPKENLYRKILPFIPWDTQRTLKVVEFGFGTGAFLVDLVNACQEKRQPTNVFGFDLSQQMGEIARTKVADALHQGAKVPVAVRLIVGVNCLDPCFAWPELWKGSVDATVQLQFGHYAPNAADSALGRKLAQEGINKVNKREWLGCLHGWLRPGGRLIEFDDFDAENPIENEMTLRAWDLWVLRHLIDPEVQRGIGRSYPKLMQSIVRGYAKRDSVEALLAAVARHRRKRRTLCREETVAFRTYGRWLGEVFGFGNPRIVESGLQLAHERFKMLVSEKP